MKFCYFGRPFLSHYNNALSLSLSESCPKVLKKILKEIMHSDYMAYGYILVRDPCPRGNEIYNFGRPFFDHYSCLINMFVLCLGEENTILNEIMHFHYMTYMATPQHKNPCPGGHEIIYLVDPSLVIITLVLVCMDHAPE